MVIGRLGVLDPAQDPIVLVGYFLHLSELRLVTIHRLDLWSVIVNRLLLKSSGESL
jgi:hypothetical protein